MGMGEPGRGGPQRSDGAEGAALTPNFARGPFPAIADAQYRIGLGALRDASTLTQAVTSSRAGTELRRGADGPASMPRLHHAPCPGSRPCPARALRLRAASDFPPLVRGWVIWVV